MAIMTIGFNPAVDRILECPDFHIGGHQQAKQIARLAAGKAANVNRALAQLSTDSIATGFVGTDDLEFFHEQLMSAGLGRVLCRFVEVQGATRENITILDSKRKVETHLRDRGFAVSGDEMGLLEQKISHELKPGDLAVFSGSLCEGVGADRFAGLLEKCVAAGAKVAVDSSGEPLKAAVEKRIWLVKPNLVELRQLVGTEVPNAASAIREAATGLLGKVEWVLVTRGSAGGAILLGPAGAFSARLTTKETPVRTVGCGDHLLAGFISEMAAGRDPERALAFAVAVATARALSVTMDEFDMEEVKKALVRIEVEKI